MGVLVVNGVQRLIADFLADNPGENYSTIARRGGLKRTTVQAAAQRAVVAYRPREETLRALARGLECSVATVRAAAGLSAPGGSSEVTDADELVLLDLVRRLDRERFQVVLRRARAMVAELEG